MELNIINYTLINFLQEVNNRPDELRYYFTILNNLELSNTQKEINNRVLDMTLREVDEIKQLINSNIPSDLISIVAMFMKVDKKDIIEFTIIDFFSILNEIRKQIEQINQAEINGLSSTKINVRWEAVNGSDRMAKFGIYNTLDKLSNGNPKDYDFYLDMPYREVFTILLMKKEQEEIQHEMNNIKLKDNA